MLGHAKKSTLGSSVKSMLLASASTFDRLDQKLAWHQHRDSSCKSHVRSRATVWSAYEFCKSVVVHGRMGLYRWTVFVILHMPSSPEHPGLHEKVQYVVDSERCCDQFLYVRSSCRWNMKTCWSYWRMQGLVCEGREGYVEWIQGDLEFFRYTTAHFGRCSWYSQRMTPRGLGRFAAGFSGAACHLSACVSSKCCVSSVKFFILADYVIPFLLRRLSG